MFNFAITLRTITDSGCSDSGSEVVVVVVVVVAAAAVVVDNGGCGGSSKYSRVPL